MKKILLILAALTVSAAAFAEKITTVAGITSGNKYYIGATTGGDDATLDGLVFKGKATKMEYEVGDAFDPAGLEVWGIYTKIEEHDSTSQIKSGITWTLDPETFGDDDVSDNASVTIVASYEGFDTTDTTITGIKVNETKYYAKNNWNGEEWTWKEMTKSDKNVYTLERVVFGGTGVNINTKKEDTDALWFAAENIILSKGLVPPTPHPINTDSMPRWDPAPMEAALEAPTLLAGDTIKLFFNAADSTLRAAIVGRPAPAARKEFVFVAGEAADSDPAVFAKTWGADGSSETVKMSKKEDGIYVAEILTAVDSVVLVRCATGATEIIWEGEGMNVWNQTGNYHLSDTMYFGGWVEETNLFTLTSEAPKPVETKYYARNNWDGEEEWTWKEMTQLKETFYTLDSVVFGGTGVNINTKEDDTDALWFAAENIILSKGLVPPTPHPINTDSMPRWDPAPMEAALEAPTLLAGDTIKLFFNAADSTLRAAIVGRPAPAARKEFVFVAGAAADSDPAMFAITWGADGSHETVEMTKKEDDIYVAEILTAVDSVVLVRCAAGATEIIWDGEGKNVLNQTVNYLLSDTMYFGGWVEGTNLFILTTEPPKPAPKVDKTGITINGRKYGFPVRMVTDIE